MKLVELLARELEQWPEGVVRMCQSVVDSEFYGENDPGDCIFRAYPKNSSGNPLSEAAYEYVTRAQWQAERDRQKGGEWKRHRGGKCPVQVGTKVSTRHRDGEVVDVHFHTAMTGSGPATMNAIWKHTGDGHDIMAYKIISQPQAEDGLELVQGAQDAVISCIAHNFEVGKITHGPIMMGDEIVGEASPERHKQAKWDQIETPFKWRDEVTELNAYIEKYTRERDALIERLASEGFALIPPVVSVVSEFSGVDMSDWNNWQVGDVIKVISNTGGHEFAIGTEVTVITVNTFDRSYRIEVTAGGNDWWLAKDDGEFIRRP